MDIFKLINENVEISDEKLLIEKGLYQDGTFSNKFYKLYRYYQILLDKYLLDKFNLEEYDNRIANSDLLFIPVKKEDKDYYGYMSSMGLKYIYLRNNIYVEKLSNEDIDKIINLSGEEINKPSKEIMDIIDRTYQTVIDYCGGKKISGISNYGPDTDNFWFDSSELVFGLIFDDFADDNLNDDEWLENNFKQTEFINNIIDEITKKCSTIMNKKVNVIWYNEYTIEKSVLSR